MITLEEAQQKALALARPLGAERVWLDQALGRVLAEDVVAVRSQPPADNSAMDGYAVRAEDVAELPAELAVVEDIPAGAWPSKALGTGEAARIMTGAPLPEGADLVVMRESTQELGERVVIQTAGGRRDNVRDAGEDVRAGDVILRAGHVVHAPDLAMLATQNCAQVSVRRRPVVGIVATGDEVQEVGQPLAPGHIVSGNPHALAGYVLEAGGIPRYLGIARDDPAVMRRVFGAVEGCDLIVTIGGVSVGDHDHVTAVLAELGAQSTYWKVAMRPGKPNALGTLGGVPWFGLPGNPVSSQVSFLQYVRPAILKLQGRTDLFLPTVSAAMEHDHRSRKRFLFLYRGVLTATPQGYTVRSTGPQGSGISRSMSEANCLFAVPEDVDFVAAGASVRVQLLPGWQPAQAEPGLR